MGISKFVMEFNIITASQELSTSSRSETPAFALSVIWVIEYQTHNWEACRFESYTRNIGCRFTIVSNSKLPQWPIKQYIPVTPHIWLIWSGGTLHPEIYGLPLPTFSLLLVVTSHLVLEVFARQLLLFGIVCLLTSVLAKLSQHSADTSNLIFSIQPLPVPSDPSQRLWFVHDYGAL